MNAFKFSATLLLISLYAMAVNAQTDTADPPLSLNDGTIDNQFEYVIQKSYTYKGNGKVYKNVERYWLDALKSHTLDSLKAIQDKLIDTRKVIEAQQIEIDDLKSNLSTTQGSLSATQAEKNNMSLLGLQMSKTGYNLLMWSIIGGLLVFLLAFIYKFKNSNTITKSAKKALSDIEEEFEEHRRNALEREQKVRRQLQDELNKQKGAN